VAVLKGLLVCGCQFGGELGRVFLCLQGDGDLIAGGIVVAVVVQAKHRIGIGLLQASGATEAGTDADDIPRRPLVAGRAVVPLGGGRETKAVPQELVPDLTRVNGLTNERFDGTCCINEGYPDLVEDLFDVIVGWFGQTGTPGGGFQDAFQE